jgi:hypothetical protein
MAMVLGIGLAMLSAGCGGDGATPSSAAPAGTGSTEFTADSADFPLTIRSDIGTHDAYVTFTSRSDGKTDAVVDFYVPRTPETRGDVYPVSIQEGECSSLGDTTVSLGDLSAGVSIVLVDEAFDEAVLPLKEGSSSIVIKEPDKQTIAWCGPSS